MSNNSALQTETVGARIFHHRETSALPAIVSVILQLSR
jgi:hypothetical protein